MYIYLFLLVFWCNYKDSKLQFMTSSLTLNYEDFDKKKIESQQISYTQKLWGCTWVIFITFNADLYDWYLIHSCKMSIKNELHVK